MKADGRSSLRYHEGAQLRPVGPPVAGYRMAPASRESGNKAGIAGSLEESDWCIHSVI